eukprot:9361186-Karenia_brevis.AAC.1
MDSLSVGVPSSVVGIDPSWSPVLRGLRRQLQLDGRLSLSSLERAITGHDPDDFPEEEVAKFYDDVSGELLPRSLVMAARKEE